MKAKKREKRLLNLVYLLCLLLFTALGFLQQPFDKFALIMGVVLYTFLYFAKLFKSGNITTINI